MGVRRDFRGAKVAAITVAPFYETTTFGLSSQQMTRWREVYEQVTVRWLTEHGFDVVGPRAFAQHMTERGAWQQWRDGIFLEQTLRAYFEPDLATAMTLEASTVRALHQQGDLPSGALLFAEIVYHSDALCRVVADDARPDARVIATKEARRAQLPIPCVITHLQAKLVEPATARTMWFDRQLVEMHVPEVTEMFVLRAVAVVVSALFGGDEAITELR